MTLKQMELKKMLIHNNIYELVYNQPPQADYTIQLFEYQKQLEQVEQLIKLKERYIELRSLSVIAFVICLLLAFLIVFL
jgi:hypothetical protein